MKQGFAASLMIAGAMCSSGEWSRTRRFSVKNMLSLKETNNDIYMNEFVKFIADFGKSYSSQDEFDARYQMFEKQMIKIQQQNSENGSTY